MVSVFVYKDADLVTIIVPPARIFWKEILIMVIIFHGNGKKFP